MHTLSTAEFRSPDWMAAPGEAARPARLEPLLLGLIAFCVAPALGCLYLGHPALGGKWLFGCFLPLLAWCVARGDVNRFFVLAIGCMPAVMLLRGFFVYNAPIAILGAGAAMCFVVQPRRFARVWRIMRLWFLLGGAYWLASFLYTGEYYANFRVLEMLFSACGVLLLTFRPKHLATAFLGVAVSVIAIAIGFLPHGERLGMAHIGEHFLGNPVTLGLPMALVFLLLVANGGKRLLLDRHPTWRVGLLLATTAFLLLSTSRASWVVVLAGCGLLALRRWNSARLWVAMGLLAALVAVSIGFLARTERGAELTKALEKTFTTKHSAKEMTTGRSEQWKLFARVLPDLPLWGAGAGSGRDMYAKYSLQEDDIAFHNGQDMAWHSLFMQVGVETGLLGLAALAVLFCPLVLRSLGHLNSTGDEMPLLATVGYLLIALTVSGLDAASGLYLGLSLASYGGPTTPRHGLPGARLSAQRDDYAD